MMRAFLLALLLGTTAFAADPVWTRLLVELAPPDTARAERIAEEMGGRLLGVAPGTAVYVIEIDQRAATEEAIALLKRRPGVRAVQTEVRRPPSFVPNDPSLSSSWHLQKIGAQAAWDYSQGAGVTMAVCDSGVNAHPDLVLQLPGWNAYSNNTDTTDVYGHGTKVAGAVAMQGNNGVGSAGVAFKTKIWPGRVTDPNGWGYDSAIASCITKAADAGARGANVSFGGVCASPIVISAAQYMRSKGGVVTASSGNTGTQNNSPNSPELTCVGSSDPNDNKSPWSTFGPGVDILAPGENIFTTTREGGYAGASGTSFAAPVTLGVYALLIAAAPHKTPAELDALLFSSADVVPAGKRVNAQKAVAAVSTTPMLVVPTNLRLVN